MDEIWSFVRCKEATKERTGSDDHEEGDSYCFLAMERTSKLILAWHLGRRTARHCDVFVEKLDRATSGRFQVTSDGFNAYLAGSATTSAPAPTSRPWSRSSTASRPASAGTAPGRSPARSGP